MHPFAYIIIVLGIIFFLYQVLGGTLAVISGGVNLDKNVHITRIILSFGQFMLILAPAIFFTRLQTSQLKDTFRLYSPNTLLLLLSILGIILIQPFLQGYMFFQDSLLNNIPFFGDFIKKAKEFFELLESAALKIVTAYSFIEFLVVVFVICITPAICEEVLFRGFVLKNLESFARPSITIFLSGFLFAVYHFQPFNIIPLMVLGIFLGFIVYFSNSIYPAVICHFLNNLFASLLLYVYGKEEFETPQLSGSEIMNYSIMSIGSFLLFVMVLLLFYKFRYKPVEASPQNE
ncbi:MAG: CPBP family glutamic-type intramembrane protease [Ignavibacteria bacterium]